ncbi:hypothetical protein [Dysgonomonas sp. 511]|uniref:hypothetical protein n=1 Tax=Dysgonomonas sp. 511 TaxID=2302930 RepID=UPI0013D238E7|nr:hypothetical protein [Dysgonomonas sp. 511]NDV78516.1 hypothetical protein [Dysgonomonas sp. 511]
MKYNIAIYISVLLLFVCMSCGDDEKENLRYSYSIVENPKMYVGSEEAGGIEVAYNDIPSRLKKLFTASLPVYEALNGSTIAFSGDDIILDSQSALAKPERSPYKFEGSSLYIYKRGEWLYFAEGGNNYLTVRQHYITYKKNGEGDFVVQQAKPMRDMTGDTAAEEAGFGTISEMKNISDTLIFATRNTIFE